MEDQKKINSVVVVVTVDVHKANDLLLSGHRFLDVRTEEEFRQGHLENSLNIPYMFDSPTGRVKNPKFLDQVLAAYNPDDHIVVGCRSGIRSLYATNDLLNKEFKHVSNMGGGYIDWVEKGFDVKKPTRDTEKSTDVKKPTENTEKTTEVKKTIENTEKSIEVIVI